MKKFKTTSIILAILLFTGVLIGAYSINNTKEPIKVYEALETLGEVDGFKIDYSLINNKDTIVIKIEADGFHWSNDEYLNNIYDDLVLSTNDTIENIINDNNYKIKNIRVTLIGGNRILSRCENGNITF